MMKYNKSEIMKKAWNLFRMSKKWTTPLSFSECLCRAWERAKKAIAEAKALTKEQIKIINGARCYMHRGVIAEAGRMGWNVTGSTYYARKELKRMGFFFDAEARCWATQEQDVAARFMYY